MIPAALLASSRLMLFLGMLLSCAGVFAGTDDVRVHPQSLLLPGASCLYLSSQLPHPLCVSEYLSLVSVSTLFLFLFIFLKSSFVCCYLSPLLVCLFPPLSSFQTFPSFPHQVEYPQTPCAVRKCLGTSQEKGPCPEPLVTLAYKLKHGRYHSAAGVELVGNAWSGCGWGEPPWSWWYSGCWPSGPQEKAGDLGKTQFSFFESSSLEGPRVSPPYITLAFPEAAFTHTCARDTTRSQKSLQLLGPHSRLLG